MTFDSNKKTNSAFAFAAKNQLIFDRFYYFLLGLSPESFSGLPRPSKWANRGENTKRFLKLISLPFAYFWSYFFCYGYICFKFLEYTVRRIRISHSGAFDSKLIAYAVCDRACISIFRACKDKDSLLWLIPPRDQLSEKVRAEMGRNFVESISILSLGDVLRSCIRALAAHHYLVKKHGTRMGLQSYALPEWMIVYSATSKISPDKIFIAEHHDRWAVMADSYCFDVRELGGRCSVELVQHGLEHEATYEKINEFTAGGGLPYRLRSVASIHVYNDEQLLTFKRNILCETSEASSELLVNYLPHEINLTEIESGNFSILFVGHPICRNFHVNLLRALKKNVAVACFYKPHPAAKEKQELSDVDWVVIDDPQFFPKVDLVVAYPSTLVSEYATHGIPSVVHDIQAEANELQYFSEKIMSFMRSGAPSK